MILEYNDIVIITYIIILFDVRWRQHPTTLQQDANKDFRVAVMSPDLSTTVTWQAGIGCSHGGTLTCSAVRHGRAWIVVKYAVRVAG